MEDKVKGGLADKHTPESIAKLHGVNKSVIDFQLFKGTGVEREHTQNDTMAREIAMDHLVEDPYYYEKLEKIDVHETKKLIKKLLMEAIDLSVTDETPDTMTYDVYLDKKKSGNITVGPAEADLGKDTMEIVGLNIDPHYMSLKTFVDTVRGLWQVFPDINRFVVRLSYFDKHIWEKAGAIRLNNEYYMLQRGH